MESDVFRTGLTSCALIAFVCVVPVIGTGQKFYDDDPLSREPETRDASKVQDRDIALTYDLAENLFGQPGDIRDVRARSVNTIDEVADSSWFTNRILARPLSLDEAVRGPVTGPGPAPGPLTVTRAKPSGVSPGFVLRDSAGVTWFAQFDAASHAEAATGAAMVANKIFHALGYWQVENHIAELRPDMLTIAKSAVTETPSGQIRQLDRDDLIETAQARGSSTGRSVSDVGEPRHCQHARPVSLLRNARRRSQRPRSARASPGTARVEGVWRLDEPRRHEGQEHARRARGRERSPGAAALSAGCRVDVRRRRPRAARMGRGPRVSRRGRPDVETSLECRLVSPSVAVDSVYRVPIDRTLRGRRLRSGSVETTRADCRDAQRPNG